MGTRRDLRLLSLLIGSGVFFAGAVGCQAAAPAEGEGAGIEIDGVGVLDPAGAELGADALGGPSGDTLGKPGGGGSGDVVDVGEPAAGDDTATGGPDGAEGAPPTDDFGEPCETAADCFGGYCVESHEGKVCSGICDEACPVGWSCSQDLASGADVAFICVPTFPGLCYPCTANSDCDTGGGAAANRCVVVG
ncbi:MAG: hypothetical protein O3A25_20295, partial [Acidobacteria bacterium]|nr:hypothetical protein [Acidobacteriota bacterium]